MNGKMPKRIICYFIGVEPLRENLILVQIKLTTTYVIKTTTY